MEQPFYAEGLRFECTRCSACCRGGPGFVFLGKSDVRRLLKRLGLAFKDFFEQYCTVVDTGLGFALSLAEKPDYDCVFWSESGCSVYEDRPVQCSTYPFWASLLESRADWEREGADCPGIGRGGLVDRKEIEERLYSRRAAGTLILDRESAMHPETIDENTLLGD